MKNARRIARKPTLAGLGQLGASGDPDHHDVFPGGRPGVPATRHPWTDGSAEFRVHYYDAKLGGTWFLYFSDYSKARSFAIDNRLYARPCEVESRP